jgi:hypothetical protein
MKGSCILCSLNLYISLNNSGIEKIQNILIKELV